MKSHFYLLLAFGAVAFFACKKEDVIKPSSNTEWLFFPFSDSVKTPDAGFLILEMKGNSPYIDGSFIIFRPNIVRDVSFKGAFLGNLDGSNAPSYNFTSGPDTYNVNDSIIGKELPINFVAGSDFESGQKTQKIVAPISITGGIGDMLIDANEGLTFTWKQAAPTDSMYTFATIEDDGLQGDTSLNAEADDWKAYNLGIDTGSFTIPAGEFTSFPKNHQIKITLYRGKVQIFTPATGKPFAFVQYSTTYNYQTKNY